jgi:AAA family ATP:ADP antiporter
MTKYWRQVFDIRTGEAGRAFSMAAYLLLVLFAYYILKPVSRALFLARFDIDRVPYLHILIAVVGGIFATYYSKAAAKWSLRAAVTWTTAAAIGCLVLFWWILQMKIPWMLYVFNIWASLFGVVTVAQGWLVAANVFDARAAKRLYGLVGLGAVVGAWAGSGFTSFMAKHLAPATLLLVCAALMLMAYGAFRIAIAQKGVSLAGARAEASGGEEESFTARGMLRDILHTRHLQVIILIVLITFLVDVMVDYQLQAAAKIEYGDDASGITRFMGGYFLWQNLATFFLQLFLTSVMVRAFGVGGTLLVMPVSIGLASLGALFLSGIYAAAMVRMVEASSRYSFNRAGMELLYLPLPTELRNRTKAFVDIAFDRVGRGIGGMALVGLTWLGFTGPKQIPLVVAGLCLLWVVLSRLAHREYSRSIRKRLERRRLDLIDARVTVSDPATLRFLEETARGPAAPQAIYALSLLAESPGYDLEPLLRSLAASAPPQVVAKVFEVAHRAGIGSLVREAEQQVESGGEAAVRAAAWYSVLHAEDRRAAGARWLRHPNPLAVEGALEGLGETPELAQELITVEWLTALAASPDPGKRRLAAFALGIRGDQGTELLRRLFEDHDPRVLEAACAAAGKLKNRVYLPALLGLLANWRYRASALAALTAYGVRIAGTLGDILQDDTAPPSLRRQIPRVLRSIREQRSVDVLLASIGDRDVSVRAAVLRALNRLREDAPHLEFGPQFVTQQILEEARHFCQLHAALAPLGTEDGRRAVRLLRRTLEERTQRTVERLFRLLGLRYPPQDIYAAYRSVVRRSPEDVAAAVEFLEGVLERPLRRVVVPILEPAANLAEKAKELFGIEYPSPAEALRELVRSKDPWLVACAIAAAGEADLKALVPEIREAQRTASAEVGAVARAALVALA